jgi:hypothetical protein
MHVLIETHLPGLFYSRFEISSMQLLGECVASETISCYFVVAWNHESL